MTSVSNTQEPTCLIIGAGIAGLSAGRELHRQGIHVTILEKARGVGGRMATRRFAGGVFDHGTQYFAPASAWFQTRIDEWVRDGYSREWFRVSQYEMDPRFVSAARYCGLPAMTAIPKHLAEGLDLHTEVRVSALRQAQEQWQAVTVEGQEYHAQACILTAPLPQSLEIIAHSDIDELPDLGDLRDVTYNPCITVLATCAQAPSLPDNGVLELAEGVVLRIMDNHRKGISPDCHAVTIHASADFSREHFDSDPAVSGALLLEAALPLLGVPVREWQAHRWRFSTVPNPVDAPYFSVREAPPLILAGDAFGNNGVEGAARSGLRAAQHVRDCFARLSR
ncbi:MAG: FAD-dependent oxidoreductase [Bacteroidia bacterium]|nr:FAD-dependent oxidoreductase [Bacteroidia bacterium]